MCTKTADEMKSPRFHDIVPWGNKKRTLLKLITANGKKNPKQLQRTPNLKQWVDSEMEIFMMARITFLLRDVFLQKWEQLICISVEITF